MTLDATLFRDPTSGLILDLADAPTGAPAGMDAALAAMAALESGAIANADEGRQVGHYWLRNPSLAPTPAQARAIEGAWASISALSTDGFTDVLNVGIGGSALGPQFLAAALASPDDPVRLHFLDNTDPEGLKRVLAAIDPATTLVLVVSKSGGTVETRNGMEAAMARWAEAGLPFHEYAIAITGEGSRLDVRATNPAAPWRARLPVWDWVGGRTSVTGPVGLAPMALCGWDWRALLAGAAHADALGRRPFADNPSALIAAAWYQAGGGRGDRALVVEPYRDRLSLLGRYLQQLIMESVGKRLDRDGRVVHQGLTVYGNKGSTDQHAFMQQVRDGRDDAFVHFVETTEPEAEVPLEDGTDASDHLLGFLRGTRAALHSAGRPSLTLRLPRVDAHAVGLVIALFERAVGIYAELVGVNAYHQPGVEAGKLAARDTLAHLHALRGALRADPEDARTLGARVQCPESLAWRLLDHLVATGRAHGTPGAAPSLDQFSAV